MVQRASLLAATLALASTLVRAATPASVAAHVNRTEGPYTFLLILVEEPTFEDNHAGFQFWVRRDGVPVLGLEDRMQARAAGHGSTVDMEIAAVDASGFYMVDRSTGGVPFDLLGGGEWSLTLSGSIDGTQIDLEFPVTFPSYPRVGVVAAGGEASIAAGGSWLAVPPWVLPALTAALGGVLAFGLYRRRRA